MSTGNRYYNQLILFAFSWLFIQSAATAPGDILFSDNFENGISQWTRSNNGRAGIGTHTSNSPSHSLYLYKDTVWVTSDAINAAVSNADLTLWLRRGHDSFSEEPEDNEDLLIQYRDSSSNWVTLGTFLGSGTPGEIYNLSYSLPTQALHSNLQIRFYLLQGSNGQYDFWHIDDVVITEGGTVTLNPPIGDWRFDELSWNSTPDEVLDYSCNDHHGTAFNTSPVAGVICNAADLSANSTSDYITLDGAVMNGLSDFTASVWVRTNDSSDSTILSAASGSGSLGANEATWYFRSNSQFWPTITASPFDDNTRLGASGGFRDNAWHHLVWTRDASARTSCFYVDSALRGCATHPDSNDSNPLSVMDNGLYIGQEQDSVGGSFELDQDWEGLLDELLIFSEAFNSTEIRTLYNHQLNGNNWDGSPRVCGLSPCSSLDHYEISLTSPGVTCEAEPVIITAIGIDGNPYAPGAGHTITITTSPNADNWSLISGNSVLTNLGSGQAS
ncbi:MAG: LamG domain-containing protein [Chromatiales bacterium]|nr:LamG domain-containing protein [Chromatiales bacterium]